MNTRNRHSIEYEGRGRASSARNRIDAVYALSGPYKMPYNTRNPPAPGQDAVQDRLGALMIELEEASRYGSV